MSMSPEMAARIGEAIGRLTPESLGHINHEIIVHQALPLHGTIGEVWLLRPDGSLWRSDADFGLPFEPLPPPLRLTAIVAGTERYPWLADLLPARPADAVTCATCGGRGRIGLEKKVFCPACSALGWRAAVT